MGCRYCLDFGLYPPFSPDARTCPYCLIGWTEATETQPEEISRMIDEGCPNTDD